MTRRKQKHDGSERCQEDQMSLAQLLGALRDDVKDIGKTLSKLQVQFGEMSGAYTKELEAAKALGKERFDTHSTEIRCIWERLETIRPEQIREKLNALEKTVRDNSSANRSQDARMYSLLVETLKWIGGLAIAVIGTWFAAKKL